MSSCQTITVQPEDGSEGDGGNGGDGSPSVTGQQVLLGAATLGIGAGAIALARRNR